MALGLIGLVVVIIAFIYAVRTTTVPTASAVSQAQTTIIYYDDGRNEIGRLGEANRVSVALTQVPLDTQHAVLAAEDRTFYQHGGFSPKGLARAFYSTVFKHSTQGGSTITQQYAKNAYLTADRTYKRKIKELLLSMKLETVTSKNKILEDYLNTIYFGRGAYGIETAANQYFGKPVRKLSVEQSAMLAAIIQAPNGLAPEKHLPELTSRWNYVLDGMVTSGWLSADKRATMTFPKIKKYSPPNTFGGPTGFLVEQTRKALLDQGITEDEINRAGYRVITTFNKKAETAAINAVNQEGPKSGTTGLRIGLASVRPNTGDVVAIYGGADFLKNQVNNATQAIGQAGSTFKTFTLAAALENKVSLASTFSGKNHTKVRGFDVVNDMGQSYGDKITVLKGIEESVNSVFIQIADKIGLETAEQGALRAGMPSSTAGLQPNLAFTLGTASPHVVDVAGAYATFAGRGVQVSPHYINKVLTRNDNIVYEYKATPVQAFSTDVADTVNFALQQVVKFGTGRYATNLGRPAAGKTGTTDDNKSAWFTGYTPDLATSVMLIKDGPDGNPVTLHGVGGMFRVFGASFPTRIWTAYMKAALEGTPVSNFAPLPKGQPNGAKPTDSPSASPVPLVSPSTKPSSSASASAKPSPTGTCTVTPSPTPSVGTNGATTTPTPIPYTTPC